MPTAARESVQTINSTIKWSVQTISSRVVWRYESSRIFEEPFLLLILVFESGSAEGSRPLPGLGAGCLGNILSPKTFSFFSLSPPPAASEGKNVFGDTPSPGREDPAPLVLGTFSKVRDDSYTNLGEDGLYRPYVWQ